MGDPKFIPTQKKVTYSFRVEEENLNKLKSISELNNLKLPQLMSEIIEDFLIGKTVYNTYLDKVEGMFIDLPDITQGREYDEFQGNYFVSDISLEYEIKQIPNNLDKWDPIFSTFKSPSPHYSHEGIEFLIVPELCEYEERCYTDLTKYLYCIYFTIPQKTSEVNIEYISFMESINKLKKCENYPLLNHVLKLKDRLEESSMELRNHVSQVGDNEFEFEYIWTELNRIAREFNSGNIIPIEESKKDIKNKASLQSMTKIEKENLLKENEEMKKELKKMDSILERLNELEEHQKEFENKVLGDIDEETLENLKEHL